MLIKIRSHSCKMSVGGLSRNTEGKQTERGRNVQSNRTAEAPSALFPISAKVNGISWV